MGDCRINIVIAKELLSLIDNGNKIKEVNDDKMDIDDTNDNATTTNEMIVRSVTISADTTLRELLEEIPLVSKLVFEQQKEDLSLWDCTLYPPTNITDWISIYNEKQGTKSKTLYAAGWYPSGSLRILPNNKTPSSYRTMDDYSKMYDDVQYNTHDTAATTTVTATSNATTNDNPSISSSKPSEILNAVKTRWDNDSDINDNNDSNKHYLYNKEQKLLIEEKEVERVKKLQKRIDQLKNKKKNKKTTTHQVRKMLIKSRATNIHNYMPNNKKKTEMEDRVYLHVRFLNPDNTEGKGEEEDEEEENYYYVSRQDTIGSIISALLQKYQQKNNNNNKDINSEFLVQQKAPEKEEATVTNDYRRLPVTMRIYEIIQQGLLKATTSSKMLEPSDNNDPNNNDYNIILDQIIIRYYDVSKGEESTSLINTATVTSVNNDNLSEDTSTSKSAVANTEPAHTSTNTTTATGNGDNNDDDDNKNNSALHENLIKAIQLLDEQEEEKNNKNKSKKKSISSTSTKVKQMLIKSRAIGDKKRIKDMKDRFFFELVTIVITKNDNNDNDYYSNFNIDSTTLSYNFLSINDTLNRVLRDCIVGDQQQKQYELYIDSSSTSSTKTPTASNDYHCVTKKDLDQLTFQQAEKHNVLHPFQRIIVVAIK